MPIKKKETQINQPKGVKPKMRGRKLSGINWYGALKAKRRTKVMFQLKKRCK